MEREKVEGGRVGRMVLEARFLCSGCIGGLKVGVRKC